VAKGEFLGLARVDKSGCSRSDVFKYLVDVDVPGGVERLFGLWRLGVAFTSNLFGSRRRGLWRLGRHPRHVSPGPRGIRCHRNHARREKDHNSQFQVAKHVVLPGCAPDQKTASLRRGGDAVREE
jgi:hypothetical protein